MEHTYTHPVAALLTAGVPSMPLPWIDYRSRFGLNNEHVPELIRMATDSSIYEAATDPECWAPIHAWRTLAQLHTEEAIEPFLTLLDHPDDEWAHFDAPYVMAAIGLGAVPALKQFLADASKEDRCRWTASDCIREIGMTKWDRERICEAALTAQLEKYTENTASLNSTLIQGLAELKAKDALPLIERAFEERKVNLEVIALEPVRARMAE